MSYSSDAKPLDVQAISLGVDFRNLITSIAQLSATPRSGLRSNMICVSFCCTALMNSGDIRVGLACEFGNGGNGGGFAYLPKWARDLR